MRVLDLFQRRAREQPLGFYLDAILGGPSNIGRELNPQTPKRIPPHKHKDSIKKKGQKTVTGQKKGTGQKTDTGQKRVRAKNGYGPTKRVQAKKRLRAKKRIQAFDRGIKGWAKKPLRRRFLSTLALSLSQATPSGGLGRQHIKSALGCANRVVRPRVRPLVGSLS